jgi:hypothetical protein
MAFEDEDDEYGDQYDDEEQKLDPEEREFRALQRRMFMDRLRFLRKHFDVTVDDAYLPDDDRKPKPRCYLIPKGARDLLPEFASRMSAYEPDGVVLLCGDAAWASIRANGPLEEPFTADEFVAIEELAALCVGFRPTIVVQEVYAGISTSVVLRTRTQDDDLDHNDGEDGSADADDEDDDDEEDAGPSAVTDDIVSALGLPREKGAALDVTPLPEWGGAASGAASILKCYRVTNVGEPEFSELEARLATAIAGVESRFGATTPHGVIDPFKHVWTRSRPQRASYRDGDKDKAARKKTNFAEIGGLPAACRAMHNLLRSKGILSDMGPVFERMDADHLTPDDMDILANEMAESMKRAKYMAATVEEYAPMIRGQLRVVQEDIK